MGRFAGLLWGSVLASGVALAASEPVPSQNAANEAAIRLPAGLADPSGKIGYFASADGGIESIDLATGKVRWHTHEAQRPLQLDGDHLLAQAGVKRNRLRILRLDCASGECNLESDTIVFPSWVVTGPAHGHSFAARWHRSDRQLILDWEAEAWDVGPRKLSAQEAEAAHKRAAGIVAIDLRSGQVDVRPAEKKKETPPPPALPEALEKLSLRWQALIGDQWKVLVLDEKEGQQRLTLHTWDRKSDREVSAKELLSGKRLHVRVTQDERVLCLRESNSNPGEDHSLLPSKTPSRWSLFSVQTGKRLGRVPFEPGMHDWIVVGKRVFYLIPGTLQGALDRPNIQPLTLKAIDLKTGKKLWEHPVAGKLLPPPPL